MKRAEPLETVLELRDASVKEASRVLSENQRAENEAQAHLHAERAREAQALQEVESVVQNERERVKRGVARASDLHAEAAWRIAEDARLQALAAATRDAEQAYRTAHETKEASRAELVAREVDRKVAEVYQEKRERAQARHADLAADEEMTEAWQGKRD